MSEVKMWNFYLMGDPITCEWVLCVSLFEIVNLMALYSSIFSSQKTIKMNFDGYIEVQDPHEIEVIFIFVTRRKTNWKNSLGSISQDH